MLRPLSAPAGTRATFTRHRCCQSPAAQQQFLHQFRTPRGPRGGLLYQPVTSIQHHGGGSTPEAPFFCVATAIVPSQRRSPTLYRPALKPLKAVGNLYMCGGTAPCDDTDCSGKAVRGSRSCTYTYVSTCCRKTLPDWRIDKRLGDGFTQLFFLRGSCTSLH